MQSARFLAVFILLFVMRLSLPAQKAPDLENGFKNYGSYDANHLDTVNVQNGNLIVHAPLLPNYPQRGALSLQPLLTFNSKTWQLICGAMPSGETVCGWFKGGTGITLQRPMDVGMQRTIHNVWTGTQMLVSAQGYSLTSADGASHQEFFPSAMTSMPGTEQPTAAPTMATSTALPITKTRTATRRLPMTG